MIGPNCSKKCRNSLSETVIIGIQKSKEDREKDMDMNEIYVLECKV